MAHEAPAGSPIKPPLSSSSGPPLEGDAAAAAAAASVQPESPLDDQPEADNSPPPESAKPGTIAAEDPRPEGTRAYWDASSTDARHPKDPGGTGGAGDQEKQPETPEATSPEGGAAGVQTASDPSGASQTEATPAEVPLSESGSPSGEGVYPAYPSGVTEGSGAGGDSTAAPATQDDGAGGGTVSTRTAKAADAEEEDEEEEGGGPVKPFLDHLEDLRWTLIKVVSSILLGMLVCLVASNQLVTFLMWPLKNAQRMLPVSQRKIPLLLGTNQLARVTAGSLGLASSPSNRISGVALIPVAYGSNFVVTLKVLTNAPAGNDEPDMVVLKNYGPISAFMVALKLALYGGLVIASPFLIFFIGQFVLPALKVKEKAFLYRVSGFGSVLFILGNLFCYFLIVQVALMASVQFSQWMGFGSDEWRAEDYVSFVSKFMLGMGLSFQLPLVILTLVKIGIVDHETLSKYRPYFIVGNLVVSAVVTPSGDPLTMVLMALPLQFLYEVSLRIARHWAKKDREREATEG